MNAFRSFALATPFPTSNHRAPVLTSAQQCRIVHTSIGLVCLAAVRRDVQR
jgi:hypothetical protein